MLRKLIFVITLIICINLSTIAKENKSNSNQNITQVSNEYIKKYLASERDTPIKENKEFRNYIKGDLNDDGIDDYIFQYSIDYVKDEDRGSGTGMFEMPVFISSGSSFNYVGSIEDEGGVEAFKLVMIRNGIIEALTFDYDNNDGHCCPSIRIDLRYKIIKNKIVKFRK